MGEKKGGVSKCSCFNSSFGNHNEMLQDAIAQPQTSASSRGQAGIAPEGCQNLYLGIERNPPGQSTFTSQLILFPPSPVLQRYKTK